MRVRLEAVIAWPSVRAHLNTWQALVKLPQVREQLRQRCGFCGQWVAKNTGIKLHLRKAHAAIWNAHHADMLQEIKGVAKVAVSRWRPTTRSGARLRRKPRKGPPNPRSGGKEDDLAQTAKSWPG